METSHDHKSVIPNDTHPAAERFQLELFRQMTAAQRFERTLALSEWAIRMSRAAIRRANPGLSDQAVGLLFVETHYGQDLAERVRAQLARQGKLG